MYTDRGLRYVGLALAAFGAAGFVLCLVGLLNPRWATAMAPWLAGAGGTFCLLFVLGGDTLLTWRERRAWLEQTQANTAAKLATLAASKPATARPDHNHDWRAAAHHFVQWGNAFGFNIRDLATRGEPGRCISWDGWRLMVDYLLAVGVLAGAGQDTRWADDWDLARWQRERHSLPYPARESPPPAVSIFIHHNNANNSDFPVGEGDWGGEEN